MLEAMAIRDGEGRARGGEAARPGDDLRRLTDERTERLAAAEAALREARDACRRGEAERDILIDFLRRANACTTTEMLLQMAVAAAGGVCYCRRWAAALGGAASRGMSNPLGILHQQSRVVGVLPCMLLLLLLEPGL